MKPILISSGEPAGIGPDLCVMLANYDLPIVILGDKILFRQRAEQLGLSVKFIDYEMHRPLISKPGQLYVLSISTVESVIPGKLALKNASYVRNMLKVAADKCFEGEFAALVTAPVHKAILNEAGIPFTGHTEFFAEYYKVEHVVMLLSCNIMKVALITTHLALKEVPAAITSNLIKKVIRQLNKSLKNNFALSNPCIFVAGLNPHAGEGGYLGREEIDVIKPALDDLKEEGIDVHGPFPADTLFTPAHIKICDVFVAMYHDQGLSVLKHASFGEAVNITLGLPIIRTSVDHGTALELAGTGKAEVTSLLAAVNSAINMAKTKEKTNDHY